jgi:hypothetical protein
MTHINRRHLVTVVAASCGFLVSNHQLIAQQDSSKPDIIGGGLSPTSDTYITETTGDTYVTESGDPYITEFAR